jgi:dTDP-4-amino-4,6-dideoxygalactose transaminase
VADEIRLAYPDVGDEELRAIASVLEDGMLTMGPRVAEFEAEIARACNTAHAVAVSSGTAALHLALAALDVGPGDEVIVPAYTFPATANVVRLLGADVRLVDVDAETMNTTPELVAEAFGPRTRVVLAVHLFGRPLDWDGLAAAVPDGVALVEDAAGALGARSRGRPCGSLGVAGCLSFHPRKIVTTGEGGAVTTDDSAIAERVRSLRHHGIVPGDRFEIAAPGVQLPPLGHPLRGRHGADAATARTPRGATRDRSLRTGAYKDSGEFQVRTHASHARLRCLSTAAFTRATSTEWPRSCGHSRKS